MEDKSEDKKVWPLNSIYFYLTHECNLACRHCWIAPKFQNVQVAHEYLPMTLFLSVIQQALPLGLTSIKLTGGEPLLHPDILEILAIAQEHDLGVIVETNGTLVTPEFAQSLAKCKKKFISVSLDGSDAETHEWVRGVPGSFDRSCEGVRILAKAGLKPQIIMSLFRRNVDQIELLVRMAEEMGAESVKFNIIQSIGRGVHIHATSEALEIAEILKVGVWVMNSLSETCKIRLFFSVPPAFKALGAIFGDNGSGCGCCHIKHIIGVLGDGSFALCGIGEIIPEMIFGHAAKDPLESVWKTHPVITAIREGLPRNFTGVCGKCVMKHFCLGSCLAQNYCTSHELWAPYWLCEQALASGLFPKTRLVE
jgi:SynChlorMet cassette radical SAM/SPASM protein ScmF